MATTNAPIATAVPTDGAMAMTRVQISARLLRFGRPLLPVLGLSTFFRVTQMLLGVALFGIAAWGVGQLIPGGPGVSIGSVLAVMAGLALAKGVIRYLEQLCGHYVAFHLLAMLRGDFYRHLEPQAPAGVEGRRSGDLLARVTKDIDRIEVFYAHTIAPTLSAVIVPTIVVVYIGVVFNPWIALVLIPFLVAVGLVTPLLSHRAAAEVAAGLRARRGDMAQHLSDSVQGVREVLAFGHTERRGSELRALGESAGETITGMGRHIAVRRGLNELFVALGMLAVLFVGRALIDAGQLQWADLAVILAVTLLTFVPVLGVEEFIGDLEQSFAAARRVWSVTDSPPAVSDAPGVKPAVLDGSLAVDGVRFRYPGATDTWALDGVALAVPEGGTVAVVGPSGSGKSTLVSLFDRVWDPTEGVVQVGGIDVREIPLEQLRDHIAVVSQRTYLFNDSVAANLRLARPEATQEALEDACRRAALHETVMAMPEGYESSVGEMGERLSGGQRQRLALARALLKDSPIIILDEATSNLDVQTEAEIQQQIHEVTLGRTVLVVAHRLSTVVGSDHILVMERGKVVEQGTHGQLLQADGLYARMWRKQVADLNEAATSAGA